MFYQVAADKAVAILSKVAPFEGGLHVVAGEVGFGIGPLDVSDFARIMGLLSQTHTSGKVKCSWASSWRALDRRTLTLRDHGFVILDKSTAIAWPPQRQCLRRCFRKDEVESGRVHFRLALWMRHSGRRALE